eukprot:s2943_g4.t2
MRRQQAGVAALIPEHLASFLLVAPFCWSFMDHTDPSGRWVTWARRSCRVKAAEAALGVIRLVSTAASVELQRAGIDFYLEEDVHRPEGEVQRAGEGKEVAASSAGLPTVFQLLELLVHDFMENVPQSSLPQLTASIGAMARYNGRELPDSQAELPIFVPWNALYLGAIQPWPATPASDAAAAPAAATAASESVETPPVAESPAAVRRASNHSGAPAMISRGLGSWADMVESDEDCQFMVGKDFPGRADDAAAAANGSKAPAFQGWQP